MQVNESPKVVKLPLAARIRQAEHDIGMRRQLIAQHAVVLKQGLRRRLVSPAALLTFASLGLAAGWILGRRPRVIVDPKAAKAGDRGQRQAGQVDRLIANTLKIIAVVRTLSSFLPAASPHSPRTTIVTDRTLTSGPD